MEFLLCILFLCLFVQMAFKHGSFPAKYRCCLQFSFGPCMFFYWSLVHPSQFSLEWKKDSLEYNQGQSKQINLICYILYLMGQEAKWLFLANTQNQCSSWLEPPLPQFGLLFAWKSVSFWIILHTVVVVSPGKVMLIVFLNIVLHSCCQFLAFSPVETVSCWF